MERQRYFEHCSSCLGQDWADPYQGFRPDCLHIFSGLHSSYRPDPLVINYGLPENPSMCGCCSNLDVHGGFAGARLDDWRVFHDHVRRSIDSCVAVVGSHRISQTLAEVDNCRNRFCFFLRYHGFQ